MAKHVVRQGECLSSIAAKHGFGDWRTIYDHPKNAELKKKRPNPNVLFPGDEIFVPDRRPEKLTVKTGGQAKITVKVPLRELKLQLFDAARHPLKNEPYTVEGGGEMLAGTTDGEGRLAEKLPASVSLVRIFADGRYWEHRMGELNPLEDAPDGGISGAQGRLANLGYSPGPANGEMGPRTREAIARFQADQGLEPTGELDRDVMAKLKEVHGS